MSYTLGVGADGTAQTAQVVWSGDGKTRRFRSDNNFISWITTIFDVADATYSGGSGAISEIVETSPNTYNFKNPYPNSSYKIYGNRPTLVIPSFFGNYVYTPSSGAYISGTPSILAVYGDNSRPSYSLAGVSAIDRIQKSNTTAGNLVNVSFPDLEVLVGDFVAPYPGTDGTTTLDLPKLKAVGGTMFAAGGPPPVWSVLTTLNVPELEAATTFNFSDLSVLTSLNLPKLKVVRQWTISGTNSLLTTINIPLLEEIPNVWAISGNSPLVTSISAPSLKYVGTLLAGSLAGWTALATFSVPNLVRVLTQAGPFTFDLQNAPALANVTFGSVGITKSILGDVSMAGCALTAASVESVLVTLASLDGTNGTTTWGAGKTCDLSGGTSSGVAALTPAAVAARNTLIARGATITLNP